MISEMLGNEIIVLLLITGCYSADDNTKKTTVNTTNTDAIVNETVTTTIKLAPVSSTTITESFPLLEDLVSAEQAAVAAGVKYNEGDNNEKNTAKRTISSKFTGPIVVNEDVKLFTPADDFTRKQRINVQIIEPESHNNGQFLKETVYIRRENNTVITTKTTTSTTERPDRHKNIVAEQKFLMPNQVGLRLSNDAKQRHLTDDNDCDDLTEQAKIVVTERPAVVTERQNRILENVDIQQNTKIQKIIYKNEPKPKLVFGARVPGTTRNPCNQSLPCSTPLPYRPTSTPRIKDLNITPLPSPRAFTTSRIASAARIVSMSIVSTPTVLTTPATLLTSSVTPVPVSIPVPVPVHVPVKPVAAVVPVTEKPVYIHTHSQVPVVQKEYVQLPPKIIEKPVVHKEFVQLPPQEKIIPVEVEKLVVKEVPINNVIEKHIQHPPTVIEKIVPYPVASKPIEVEKIVQIPIDRVVEKHVPVEKPVAVPYVQYVDRPIHIPYILPVEIPVAYHVPFLVKPHLLPPQRQKFTIKTTKYGKGHDFFDWKHNHLKHIKHVIIKKPNHILADDIIAPPTIDSIGLLPPPRFQPYISDNFGPRASASINVVSAVLPNSVQENRDHVFDSSPINHNGFDSYDNKLKFVDSFSKDIRWEYGFKPPLIPSVAIDEFGNPFNED